MEHPTADQWQIVEVEKLVSDGYLDSAGKILEADKEGQSANVQFIEGTYYFNAHAIYYSNGKYINFDNATLQHIADDIRNGERNWWQMYWARLCGFAIMFRSACTHTSYKTIKEDFKMLKSGKVKLLKNEKGLTLVELLAVIVILAIIAIAVPAIGNIINKSKDRAILAEASNILAGAKIAYIDGACGKTAPDNKCDKDELKEFVDGIELGANDEVEYNETDKNG